MRRPPFSAPASRWAERPWLRRSCRATRADSRATCRRATARHGMTIRALARGARGAAPSDASVAAELAQRYLELNRGGGDPRLVAYASRALARWDGVACAARRSRARARADRADRAPLRRRARRARALVERAPRACAGVAGARGHRYRAGSLRGREARVQRGSCLLHDAVVAGAASPPCRP